MFQHEPVQKILPSELQPATPLELLQYRSVLLTYPMLDGETLQEVDRASTLVSYLSSTSPICDDYRRLISPFAARQFEGSASDLSYSSFEEVRSLRDLMTFRTLIQDHRSQFLNAFGECVAQRAIPHEVFLAWAKKLEERRSELLTFLGGRTLIEAEEVQLLGENEPSFEECARPFLEGGYLCTSDGCAVSLEILRRLTEEQRSELRPAYTIRPIHVALEYLVPLGYMDWYVAHEIMGKEPPLQSPLLS